MNNDTISISTLKALFMKNGGSESAFQQQMGSLLELIQLDVIKTLLEQKPPPAKLTSENEATKYIQQNFSEEVIAKSTDASVQKVVSDYFKALSA